MSDGHKRIRGARRGDTPALVDLRVQFLGETVHDEPRLRLLPDVRERAQHALPVWMEQPGLLLLVAEGDATGDEHPPVVGYAMGTAEVYPPVLEHQHVGVIAECYVVPEARGAGLYGELLELLSEMLIARGAQVLRIELPAGNTDAFGAMHERGFSDLQFTMARPLSSD